MTHMVIFRSPQGKPGYHQAEGLDEAMKFAEMLRNQEQVTDARIFRMDEVPIEFKAYYRVEMASAAGSGDMAAAASGEVAEPVPENAAAPEPEPENAEAPEPEPESQPEHEAAAHDWVETGAMVTGQEAEPEPAEAGALGSGRHGRFTRR